MFTPKINEIKIFRELNVLEEREEVGQHFHGLGNGVTNRLWDPEKLTPQLWALGSLSVEPGS